MLFSIKKYLKALIRRLKVKYAPSIVYNYPYTTNKVVNNTISIDKATLLITLALLAFKLTTLSS